MVKICLVNSNFVATLYFLVNIADKLKMLYFLGLAVFALDAFNLLVACSIDICFFAINIILLIALVFFYFGKTTLFTISAVIEYVMYMIVLILTECVFDFNGFSYGVEVTILSALVHTISLILLLLNFSRKSKKVKYSPKGSI